MLNRGDSVNTNVENEQMVRDLKAMYFDMIVAPTKVLLDLMKQIEKAEPAKKSFYEEALLQQREILGNTMEDVEKVFINVMGISSGLSAVSKTVDAFSPVTISKRAPETSKEEVSKEEPLEVPSSMSSTVEDNSSEPREKVVSSEEEKSLLKKSQEEVPIQEEKEVASAISAPEQQKEEVVESALDVERPVVPSDSSPVSAKPRLRRFERVHKGVVKAILVNKTQYQKLCASLPTQEKILEQKEVLFPLPSVDVNVVNSEDREVQMEEMMEQAKELYKQGKADEAQSLLTKISAMNSKK